jgi:arylsulfatase A-like enzyme
MLLAAAVACSSISGFAAQHKSERPPNILFIAIDDMKTIGSVFAEDPGNFLQRVYPDKALRTEVANRMTPNIQRLANRGVTFMNAYCRPSL